MKKLDLSAVTSSVGMPQKSGVLDHIQSAYQETIAELAKSLIGSAGYDPTKAYVLSGCVNSGTFPVYTITAGAIFYAGEIYLVDAASFTVSGANVGVASIVTSYFSASNADPVVFTDGNSRNVHEIRKIAFAGGLSGSGIADVSALKFISVVQSSEVLKKGGTTAFTPTLATDPVNKSYVDALITLKPKLSGTSIVGDVGTYPTGTVKTISLGITLPNANYFVMGMIISAGSNRGQDATVIAAVFNKTTTSFDVQFTEVVAVAQNVNWDWILFQS